MIYSVISAKRTASKQKFEWKQKHLRIDRSIKERASAIRINNRSNYGVSISWRCYRKRKNEAKIHEILKNASAIIIKKNSRD